MFLKLLFPEDSPTLSFSLFLAPPLSLSLSLHGEFEMNVIKIYALDSIYSINSYYLKIGRERERKREWNITIKYYREA